MCRVKISLCGYSGLDVPGIMSHYIQEHSMLYEGESVQCLEKEGRERFITFAAFIINGTGTYHIDPQTRDHRRMDLVVLFRGQRYIIELKIWHSDRYDEEAERQISEYLDR